MISFTDWLHAYADRWHDAWLIFGALATAAAVVVALNGIRNERQRATRAEAERDHERAEVEAQRSANRVAEHRRQAQRVVAYAQWTQDPNAVFEGEGWWAVHVDNHSDAPVFDLRVETYFRSKLIATSSWRALTAGAEQRVSPRDMGDPEEPPVPLLFFRDLAGTRWRRESDGTLTEVDQYRQPLSGPVR